RTIAGLSMCTRMAGMAVALSVLLRTGAAGPGGAALALLSSARAARGAVRATRAALAARRSFISEIGPTSGSREDKSTHFEILKYYRFFFLFDLHLRKGGVPSKVKPDDIVWWARSAQECEEGDKID